MGFSELISMKHSRKSPQEGDVFVVQPFLDTFYYGKVIQVNLQSGDSFVDGMMLVYIYNVKSNSKNTFVDLDHSDLLIAPVIVNKLPWVKGFFETIGNFPITEKDQTVSYGFWHFMKKIYVDAQGNVLEKKPQYWTDYGLASYVVVGENIQKALQNQQDGDAGGKWRG